MPNTMGAMKQGGCMCGAFKVFNLTYLHVLRACMVYITLWYILVELTNLPLCSAHTWTPFHHPQYNWQQIIISFVATCRSVK